jgi:hypothetical protein
VAATTIVVLGLGSGETQPVLDVGFLRSRPLLTARFKKEEV